MFHSNEIAYPATNYAPTPSAGRSILFTLGKSYFISRSIKSHKNKYAESPDCFLEKSES